MLGPDVAWIAGVIGEPARAAILAALVDGRALPAGELAFIGKIAPPTASFHLRKLIDARLIAVERQGRHCYYRLADERVAAILESLASLAPVRDRTPVKDAGLRFARSCYRYLAGRLAVEVHRALFERQWLTADSESTYVLTAPGMDWCRRFGLDLPARIPAAGKPCLDWTERRPHIGGPLGVALFSRLLELQWVVRISGTRAVRLTQSGARGLGSNLGIAIPG